MKGTQTTGAVAADYDKKPTNFWSNNRALRRALIPQDVRQKILETLDYTRISSLEETK